MSEPLQPTYNFCEKLSSYYDLIGSSRVYGTEKITIPADAVVHPEDPKNQGECLSKEHCRLGHLCTGIITLLLLDGRSSLFRPVEDFALPATQGQSSALSH